MAIPMTQPPQPAPGSTPSSVATNAYNILTQQQQPTTLAPAPQPSSGNSLGATALGATWGAGVGSAIFPGVGTAIGAGLGGVIGHWLGSNNSSSPKSQAVGDPGGVADLQTQSRAYLTNLGVAPADQNKILAQIQFQAQQLGATVDQLPQLVNTLLPQYAQAAVQINQQTSANDQTDRQRASRMAAVQAYLLPQLNGYLNTAQSQADAFSKQTGNNAYGMQQAAANAAYAQQLSALVGMQTQQQQPSTPVPTLDDYLKQAMAATTQPIKIPSS